MLSLMETNISINHQANNFTELALGDLTIWFSYRTPIGFMFPGEGRVVRVNEWGPTTGKHMNKIDDGDKTSRINGEEFTARLSAITAMVGAS